MRVNDSDQMFLTPTNIHANTYVTTVEPAAAEVIPISGI